MRLSNWKKPRKKRENQQQAQTLFNTKDARLTNKASNTIIQKNFIPPLQQLKILLLVEPHHEVYNRFLNLSKKRALTKKEYGWIMTDFQNKIILGKGLHNDNRKG